jgi:hypothetical protein
LAVNARVREDLPHVVKRPAAQQQVQHDGEPAGCDESETEEDSWSVAVEVFGESEVKGAQSSFEQPQQDRITGPSTELNL